MSSAGEFGRQRPEQRINDLRQEFQDILKRFKELEVRMQSPDEKLAGDLELAHDAASLMVQRTIFDLRKLRLKVKVLEGTRAEISSDYRVFDPDIHEFDALQIEDVGFGQNGFQVTFYDPHPDYPDGLWWAVYGYGIQIEPYFPQPTKDEPAE